MSSPLILRTLLAGLILGLPASTASAAPTVRGSWSNVGPEGGGVSALVSVPGNPRVLYAGIDSGAYKSVDGGASWHWAGNGLDVFSYLSALAVDPVHPSTLYAGQFSGVFKSTNGGVTWARASHFNVSQIAAHPRVSGTVFVAGEDGLYQTNNGGARWKLVTRGLLAPPYKSYLVTIDAANPRRMFASVHDPQFTQGGLYRSLDGGFSWQPVHSGPMDNLGVSALAIDPRSPNILYAGTFNGVFKSTDGGESWRLLSSPLLTFVRNLIIHPTRSNVLYAGTFNDLFISVDSGDSWSLLSPSAPFSFVASFLISPSHPETLYAAAASFSQVGLYRSDDGGSSWTLSSRGLFASSVRSLAVDHQDSNRLWIINDHSLFKSVDRARSWVLVQPEPDPGTTSDPSTPVLVKVVVDPLDSATVYVQRSDSRILRSRDGGEMWEAGSASFRGTLLKADPYRRGTLWAAAVGGGLLRSTDQGDTWTAMSGPASMGLYVGLDFSSPSTVYAVGSLNFLVNLVRSDDGGATWSPVSDGLSDGLSAVAVDQRVPDTLYTGTFDGNIYRSTDRGATWTTISRPVRRRLLQSLVASPTGPIYRSFWFDNVYESSDGGQSWAPFAKGGRSTFSVLTDLAVDPKDPCRIYLATQNRGLFAFDKSGTAECP